MDEYHTCHNCWLIPLFYRFVADRTHLWTKIGEDQAAASTGSDAKVIALAVD